MNKETEYGFVLLDEQNKVLYSFHDGIDGTCMTLHSATQFDTEQQAINKRDYLYNKYSILFDVKRIMIEYTMFNVRV